MRPDQPGCLEPLRLSILTVPESFVVMKKCVLIAALLLAFVSPSGAADQGADGIILLRLPESVIASIIEKALPLVFPQGSGSLTGSISVTEISDLVFTDGSVAAAVSVQGRDVELNTSIAGSQVRLKLGEIDLNFDVAAALGFDRDSQTLFIHPTVDGLGQQENSEAGRLILALFNDQQIPLRLDAMQPIITDIGSRELVIDTRVHDVAARPGSIEILLEPNASVREK